MGERSPVSLFMTPRGRADANKVILSIANKQSGLDNIPVKMYNFLFEKLNSVIIYVFNLSIEQDIFPG